MSDSSQLVAALIWIALIGAWFAHQRWSAASALRQKAGLCARCAKQPVTQAEISSVPVSMCSECLELTRRNYRAGAWFFYSVAALFALMAPFIIWSDFRQFGTRPAVQDAAVLIGVTCLAAGMAHGIQYFGAKVR